MFGTEQQQLEVLLEQKRNDQLGQCSRHAPAVTSLWVLSLQTKQCCLS